MMEHLGGLVRYALDGALITFFYLFFIVLGGVLLTVGYAICSGLRTMIQGERLSRRTEQEIIRRQREYFEAICKNELKQGNDS